MGCEPNWQPSFGEKEVAEKWLRNPNELQNKATIFLITNDIPGSVSKTNPPVGEKASEVKKWTWDGSKVWEQSRQAVENIR